MLLLLLLSERVVPVDEQLDDFRVTTLGGLDQTIRVVLEHVQRIGAVLQQQLDDTQVTVLTRERQRVVLVAARAPIDVDRRGTVEEQILNGAELTGARCFHERREALLRIALIGIGARFHERVHHVRVTVLARQRQRRLATRRR